MDILKKLENVWSEVERGVLSITVILMSIMLVGNALSRYLFSKSWGFTEEIGQLSVVVLTFMGIGYAARKGMHIEMSGFYDMMSEKYQRIVKIIINLVTAIIMLVCTYLSYQYVNHLFEIGQVTTILRLPLYLVMIVVPLGFLLAFIRYLVDFIQITFNRV